MLCIQTCESNVEQITFKFDIIYIAIHVLKRIWRYQNFEPNQATFGSASSFRWSRPPCIKLIFPFLHWYCNEHKIQNPKLFTTSSFCPFPNFSVMPPKAAKGKEVPAERPILGRFSSHLKIGIVSFSLFSYFFIHMRLISVCIPRSWNNWNI